MPLDPGKSIGLSRRPHGRRDGQPTPPHVLIARDDTEPRGGSPAPSPTGQIVLFPGRRVGLFCLCHPWVAQLWPCAECITEWEHSPMDCTSRTCTTCSSMLERYRLADEAIAALVESES